ncbi:hypothetical protein FIBSPDRAFT_863270 [Athelia psychrophila]|uniref:SMODS and SLOG-associating 2TM effector domain-containing protein n=1 Tax=Athelia psychrophila TaxID=1759441 RepID=A0A166HJ99_9AGAM|nr:hypothetical protein FIBSPDRAFT_863270 [Fibularhizoctonia sp. CBS 109695]
MAQQDIHALAEAGALPPTPGSGIRQPRPVLASGPQDVTGGDATRTAPPPTPLKTEGDRLVRGTASRPMSLTPDSYEPASGSRPASPTVRGPASRPMSLTHEGNEEPGMQSGFPLPREPIRRSSTTATQPQAPSVMRGREGQGRMSVRIDGSPPDRRGPPPARRQSTAALDWMVPENEKMVPRPITAGERLQPTLDHANTEKKKFERRAMLNGWTLNTAIGLQVVLGALVTGLSSVVSPTKVGLVTSVLGGMSTLVASYLARMRGSREPELSLARVKDLDHFIRDAEVFQLDQGNVNDGSHDKELEEFRHRFEELLEVAEA